MKYSEATSDVTGDVCVQRGGYVGKVPALIMMMREKGGFY